MKKREKKLQLNRETVRRLDPRDVRAEDLLQALGGTGIQTSCIKPNCCGTVVTLTVGGTE
jgi:hypothetical protein